MVVKVAAPDAFSIPVPREVVPSRKVRVPVGTAVPEDGVTVAVKVTFAPVAAEDGPARVVVVAIKFMESTATFAVEELGP